MRDVQLLPYPFFVRIGKDGMAEDSPVTEAMNAAILHWSSPVKVTAPDLKSDANEAAIESLEIAHEGLKLMKI